jgi:hypothetical protein
MLEILTTAASPPSFGAGGGDEWCYRRFLPSSQRGHHRGPVKYFFGLLAIVGVVGGATVAGYRAWDKATHTREDNGGVLTAGPSTTAPSDSLLPAKGQVALVGGVTGMHIDGATVDNLPMPITVTTADRGVGGATITPVEVDGHTTSIDWQAGQPMPISGDGGNLLLKGVTIDAGSDGISIVLDGTQSMTPGTYKIDTSVAVGSTPMDRVTFSATDKTTAKFRGTASAPYGEPLHAQGAGSLSLDGKVTVTHPDGSTTEATHLELDQGLYRLTLTPTPQGDFNLQALLQGNVK